MTTTEFEELIKKKKIELHDEDNIFPPPTSDYEAFTILRDHFLGENWYVVDPLSHEQCNTEAVYDILLRYPNAEQNKANRRKKVANFFHDIIDNIFG